MASIIQSSCSLHLYMFSHSDYEVVDYGSDMDVTAKKLQIPKYGHCTIIFNEAAQKLYTITTISKLAPKISVSQFSV